MTAPPVVTEAAPSIAARVVFAMSFFVSEKPRPTAADSLCPTAIARAAAPAVALIHEVSCAVTVTPAPLPDEASVLPLRARAWVLLRILFSPTEPAPATPTAEPLLELAMPPAAPMPRLKIPPSMSASSVMLPFAWTLDWSTSAQTTLASLR